MKLKVGKYNKDGMYHECWDEENHLHRVEIMVDGGIEYSGDDYDGFLISLEGREILCSRLTPYEEIAHDVRLIS